MLWLLTFPVRLPFKVVRLLGLRRLVVFGLGVGVGLLIAPASGVETRERLRRKLEEAGLGGPPSDGELGVGTTQ